MNKKLEYLQYGCGWSAPESWINFDSSPTLYFERLPLIGKAYTKNKDRFPKNVLYGDIVKGLPVRREYYKGVYASHVLEHLTLHDFKIAVHNTYRILRPGGIFRLVVPDMHFIADKYIKSNSNQAVHTLMREASLGCEHKTKGLINKLISLFGNSAHLWMWDFKSIQFELHNVGFVNIRKCDFGDCDDTMFKFVEDESRFINALAVEAIRN
jgi:hypothetical protein